GASTVELADLKSLLAGRALGRKMQAKSRAYKDWFCGPGRPALERLNKKLEQKPVTDVEVQRVDEPCSLQDLIESVDNHTPLPPVLDVKSKKPRMHILHDEILAAGAERSCILAKSRDQYETLKVLKRFRQEGQKAESVNRYLKLLTSHTVAAFLAKEYNNALDDVGFEGDRLEYVDACVVSFPDPTSNKSCHRFQENFVAGQFCKFSSNCGFNAERTPPACAAFAHWCYVATGGRAMVTDVQGWYDVEARKAYLTDPCVLCSWIGLMDDDYKDRGLVGFEECLQSHSCNDACERLGLHEAKPVTHALHEIREKIDDKTKQNAKAAVLRAQGHADPEGAASSSNSIRGMTPQEHMQSALRHAQNMETVDEAQEEQEFEPEEGSFVRHDPHPPHRTSFEQTPPVDPPDPPGRRSNPPEPGPSMDSNNTNIGKYDGSQRISSTKLGQRDRYCNNFITKGSCPYNGTCKYLHATKLVQGGQFFAQEAVNMHPCSLEPWRSADTEDA
ncbi:kinase-like domain-containing protein, partial [Dunaliella salina]